MLQHQQADPHAQTHAHAVESPSAIQHPATDAHAGSDQPDAANPHAAPGLHASQHDDADRPTSQAYLTPVQAGASVHLKAPATLEPGVSARLVYHLARDGAPLTDVVVSHEQELHLILVRQDLGGFQHLHPSRTATPGEYVMDVTFAEPGTYVLYAEFTVSSGQEIVQRDMLTVGAASGPAALVEDRAPKTVSADARVSLLGGERLRAGAAASLTFRIAQPATGSPVRTLRPYLGAPAHVVILDASAGSFAHTHGEAIGAATATGSTSASDAASHGESHGSAVGPGTASVTYGPEIAFQHTFPAPGRYKLWGQFLDDQGRVLTADFVVEVGL